MATIDLSIKVKEKLKYYMAKEGIKTYSDAVNLLLSLKSYGKKIVDEISQKLEELKKEILTTKRSEEEKASKV